MPTSRKRHMVTETDEINAALERVRAVTDEKVSLGELVLLGAERKVEIAQAKRDDADRRAVLREQFLDRTRSGAGVDFEALLRVHDEGWAGQGTGG
jgi:hypothetical protein